MIGWPECVCAVPHSTRKRPSSNEAAMPGARFWATGPAQAPRSRARKSARGLLAAATLVPGRDADPIGGAGRTNRLLEVHIVESTHVARDEPHALRDDLTLRIQCLHEQAWAAVARHAAVGDHAPHDERVALAVLGCLPVQRDDAGVAGDGDAIGVGDLRTQPETARKNQRAPELTGHRRTCPMRRW